METENGFMETENGFMETQNRFTMEIYRNSQVFRKFLGTYIFSAISRNLHISEISRKIHFTYRYLGETHEKRKNAFLTMPCGGVTRHAQLMLTALRTAHAHGAAHAAQLVLTHHAPRPASGSRVW